MRLSSRKLTWIPAYNAIRVQSDQLIRLISIGIGERISSIELTAQPGAGLFSDVERAQQGDGENHATQQQDDLEHIVKKER